LEVLIIRIKIIGVLLYFHLHMNKMQKKTFTAWTLRGATPEPWTMVTWYLYQEAQ
jgi:hypothetical protein